jgi:hypothetical protein
MNDTDMSVRLREGFGELAEGSLTVEAIGHGISFEIFQQL